MRPQRWSLFVLIGLVVCAAVVSGVSLPLHRPHTRHTDTHLDGLSDAFIEVQSQATVSEDSTPIENDYITFDEQPPPAPQHAPLNEETMRVYADQVKAVNSHTGQSVWGKSWSIVDDMFTPHPTKETPEISVSLKENLNKNVPAGATVDLEVTATTRAHGSQSAAMQEKDTLLVHLPTIAGDSEANLARAEFEAQTDPFQAQREAAIIEARATVTRAKDPIGHAIFSENDPDKALQKPTEVLPIEISVIEKQSRVSVEGATAARGGKKYGWLEKQYKLEDCLACRMVWRQVEMDVGPTHLWQKVQESFEHNCMDAQKSKIFFIACGDMYEDKNEMIKDYLSNKFSVQKMCERARMCGKGKADPEAWPHITIGEISDKQPIPGKFRVPKDKGGKKGKKKGKKKESNFLKALKGRVIKGLIDGGAALAAAGAGAIANGVKGLRVKKAKDLLTTIHDRVMTKARPLIKKFKDDMKARKKKGKKKK